MKLSFIKTTRFIALLLLITIGGFIFHFIYTMTIGDTYGLREKLESLDEVVSVKDYYSYEGNAFFTLLLTENRLIKLGGIGNQDLTVSDGMTIDQIGSFEIICKHSSGRAFSSGIPASKIEQNPSIEITLDNIEMLIKHYEDLHALFSRMPLEFHSSLSSNRHSADTTMICRDARSE